MARNLGISLPEPSRVEVAPGVARMLRPVEPNRPGDRAGGPMVTESFLALHRLPGVVLQWEWTDESAPSAGSISRPSLAVDWRIPRGAEVVGPEEPGEALRMRLPDGDTTVRIHVRGPRVRWQDGSWTRSGRTGFRTPLAGDGPLTVLFVLESGSTMAAGATLRRLSSLSAELEARAAEDLRAAGSELDLEVEEAGTSEAFRWARRRLHAALVHPGGRRPGRLRRGASDAEDAPIIASPAQRARIGSGVLALGRHQDAGEIVAGVVDLLREAADRGGLGSSPPARDGALDPGPTAELLGLVARFVLWTGDPGPLRSLGERLDACFRELPAAAERFGAPGSAVVVGSALAECAEAVEAAGDRDRAEGLRALLGSTKEGIGVSGLDGGSVDWTRRLERRLEEDGVGTPDPSGLAETGRLVSWLLFDLLGARGDGFYGRLRLAPRVPRQWHRFTVRGIHLADARVRLSYHGAEGRHTFRLEPTGGRVPLNVVFEPLLPATVLAAARVDGKPAEVDRYREDGRIGIRLQLPLDAPREVVLEEGSRRSREVTDR